MSPDCQAHFFPLLSLGENSPRVSAIQRSAKGGLLILFKIQKGGPLC